MAGALPRYNRLTPTAAEMEFVAEMEPIVISPSFHADIIRLIQGDVGPFRPARPVSVPLWLAIHLRKKGRCTIQPPDWLTVESLEQKLNEEREMPNAFSKLPDHFIEVSMILLTDAEDDLTDAENIRRLRQDILDVRSAKIRQGVASIKSSVAVKLNNITPMEINSVRPFFTQSMDIFHTLSNA